MIKRVIFFLLMMSASVLGQKIKALGTVKLNLNIDMTASNPNFAADDSKIIFTSSNYKGLYKYDLSSESISVISEEMGAGYNPRILNDGRIFFKTFEIANRRKNYSIRMHDPAADITEIMDSNLRLAKIPHQLSGINLIYINGSSVQKKPTKNSLQKNIDKNLAIYSDNNNLILIDGENERIINPLGKGVYVWESISSDGKYLLFTFANKGSFVCDLSGEIITNIEEAHYPKFSPDGRYISYMKDKDDGHNYTESDIFIYAMEDQETYQITRTANRIEMYPEWSNSGDKLVYHTADGEIYITELQFEN